MNAQSQVYAAVSQGCSNDEEDHRRQQTHCDGDNFTLCLRLFFDWETRLLVQVMAVSLLYFDLPL
jgi:hypothetical protein